MKVTALKTYLVPPRWLFLKIETDAGISGWGEPIVEGRAQTVAALVAEMADTLIGKAPGAIEDHWNVLYRGGFYRGGAIHMSALAGIDQALWDIKGKALGTPVCDLLGGPSRDGVLVYGHANGADLEETKDEVARYIESGYRAIRAQTGVPGVAKPYGVSRDKDFYEPAEDELPVETIWSTPQYLRHAPKLFEALRVQFGDDVELLHDVHHRLTPNEAAQLGKSLEPYRLFWLEDPTPAENQEAFRLIRQHTTTPLAVGEVFNAIWDAKDLIQNQLIDYLRATVLGCGGITHLRRIADFAALWQVRTGCHGATDLSPVTMATALHFDAWVPNFGIQEYMRHTEATDAVFPHAYWFEAGRLHPGDAPGHGCDIDEALAAKYPYAPKQLPVARLEDGTMWNW